MSRYTDILCSQISIATNGGVLKFKELTITMLDNRLSDYQGIFSFILLSIEITLHGSYVADCLSPLVPIYQVNYLGGQNNTKCIKNPQQRHPHILIKHSQAIVYSANEINVLRNVEGLVL